VRVDRLFEPVDLSGHDRKVMAPGAKSSSGPLAGVARSAPRSNRSFWMRASSAVTAGAGIAATASTARPSALLASSTSPMATMRASCLARREPSTSPVVPASPVRV
jgi:hypothetical protein